MQLNVVTASGILLALCGLFATYLFFGMGDQQAAPQTDTVVEEVRKLSDRLIREKKDTVQGIVTYTYYSDPVPEYIVPDEVPEMRTESSYTRLIDVEGEGSGEQYTMNLIAFPQDTFGQSPDGVWRYIETATTSEQAWNMEQRSLAGQFFQLLLTPVFAASVSPFASSGDGFIAGSGEAEGSGTVCDNIWSSARDASSGSPDYASSTITAVSYYFHDVEIIPPPYHTCIAEVHRAFLPFDTSSIRATATISGATLNVYVTGKLDGTDDSYDYITVVRGEQNKHTELVAIDFNNVSASEAIDSGQRKSIASLSTGAYTSFSLNATGLGWIIKRGIDSYCSLSGGISCFAIREGHDFENSTPPGAPGVTYSVSMSSSEASGTSQDPYISVTYTVPGPEIRNAIKSSAIRLKSGTVRLRSY